LLYGLPELCYKPGIEHIAKAALFPLPAFAQQETVFDRAFAVLRRAVAERAFPGASLAVTFKGKLVALNAFGHFTGEPDSPLVSNSSTFDLASVSKVVGTTTAAMILYERGLLDLDASVVSLLPAFAGDDRRRQGVSVRMLLAHSSGLPAYQKLFLQHQSQEELLSAAFRVPLATDPGSRAEYSDIGFIILGHLLEGIADERLHLFCQREIFGTLGMTRTAFLPPPSWHSTIVPTADDRVFRHRVIQGEVQDENASVLAGVAGHAGVFATAQDMAIFAHAMLNGGEPVVKPQTLSLFTRRQTTPPGTSRALGWDTPSFPSQSGKYFSPSSFGHLGYTGTSLWVDPEKQLSITLLTNRTWPDCSNQRIKQFRPAFHDAVWEALESAQ